MNKKEIMITLCLILIVSTANIAFCGEGNKNGIRNALHASKVTSVLWAKSPKKSPFETESSYFDKLFSKGKEISFILPIKFLSTTNEIDLFNELRYYPELESFYLTLESTSQLSYLLNDEKTGQFVGENAFGAKFVIDKFKRVIFEFKPIIKEFERNIEGERSDLPKTDGNLIFSESTKGGKYDWQTLIKIKQNSNDAIKMKNRFAFYVKGKLIMTNITRELTRPTTLNNCQIDLTIYNFYFDKQTLDVSIVDTVTGEVFSQAKMK